MIEIGEIKSEKVIKVNSRGEGTMTVNEKSRNLKENGQRGEELQAGCYSFLERRREKRGEREKIKTGLNQGII